jgi:glycine/D-amino acid oxidase-like deaminating enzyme
MMSSDPRLAADAPRSLWEATAPPHPDLPALSESSRADVVVVGGGYLGLSTALRLAQQGAQVVLLEGETIGFGASGRNGGQVIPGLKHDPDEIEQLYGQGRGEQLVHFAGTAPDKVFDTIERYGIQCDAVRQGWIQGAHSVAALATVQRRAAQWIRRGARAELLDKATVDDLVGCAPDLYHGGWIDRRAGSVHPLNYALGLAGAARQLGAKLYEHSPVVQIRREDRQGSQGSQDGAWRVTTAAGASVLAEQVVVATNAYTDELWPKLRQSIIAVQSFQVATEPLSDAQRRAVLREGQVVSDARRLLHYYRLDGAGRLLIGGRGSLAMPTGTAAFAHIQRALAKTFPQLADVPVHYHWSGRIAMTRDALPHLHRPAPGITLALGCNGRGVALTTAIGQGIAEHLLDGGTTPLPFPASAIKPIPFHRFHRMGVSLLVQYYTVRDKF